ncbi:YhgE/Pip domain-containing protein [uncultured Vagococcus sp.]|uniref:YhgE/Pip domain-containing protein n=1 Tax=uncultured Vagococcus sp. TaxID=189676 RepID=UPI0028D1B8BA|nr:YhgE/Pip domain-containing protein [uncultured Vagococcus sp.]
MKMTKQEFINIFKNKILLISVIAVTFIPILYASFFSKSVWDPYGRAKNLPVAVVNQDKPVTMEGQKVNVGEQVVGNLKKNHDLKWEFVSEEEAKKGMEDLYYYMIVTIPEDFSKDATTLIDKEPKKMELTYTTNGSLNYIGEEISQMGATQLESQVRDNVTQSYVTALATIGKEGIKSVDQAADGAGQLAAGTVQLESGLEQYTSGVSQANSGSEQLAAGTSQLAGNIGPLSSGVSQLNDGAGQLSSALNEVNGKVQPLTGRMTELSSGLNELSRGSQELATAIANVENGLDKNAQATIQQNIDQTKKELEAIINNTTQLKGVSVESALVATELQQISAQLNELDSRLMIDSANLQGQVADSINRQEGIEAETKSQLIADISSKVAAFESEQNAKIKAETATLSSNINHATTSANELAAQATALSELAAGIAANATTIQGSINEIEAGTNSVLNTLNIPPLSMKASVLVADLNQASHDLNMISSDMPMALNDVNQLTTGSDALATGLGQLYGQMPTLSSGVTQLNSGAAQLNSGLGELNQNSPQLMSGIDQLDDGAGQLAGALGQAATLAAKVDVNEKNIEMFADPTTLKLDEYSKVANYGEALSPYIMSLALFVGCLVFNFVFPIRKVSIAGQSARDWWLSKVAIGFAVSTAMALIEATLMLAIGLTVDNLGQFYLIALISAWAYMYLVMFFAMTFDNPGRFISMVLLVLQLGGAGGTFPMPLTNGFFNAIHPYLPMSYSIYGFREAISGGIGAPMFNKSVWVLSLLFVVFVILLKFSMSWLQKKHQQGISQLDDNQKLLAVEEID